MNCALEYTMDCGILFYMEDKKEKQRGLWREQYYKRKERGYKRKRVYTPKNPNSFYGSQKDRVGSKNPMFGRKHSQEAKRKISLSRLGNKNPMWKGEKVGYIALHNWVERHLPKPKFCMDCGLEKRLDAANISQQYKRDVLDWEWLCRKCHMTKDGRLKKFSSIPYKRRKRK